MSATGKRNLIPIAKPWMGEAEAQAAERVILSGWVTQGPEVEAFEKEFARSVGAPFACAVSSCTAALHLALLAVGVKTGDEVITASHSFIATANSIRYVGATPVFVDIQPSTFNLEPTLVEKALTRRTRAILCVHQMGMPCDLRALLDIAGRHHLPVIEDAACAIGSEISWNNRWEKIGKPHGAIACFSLHPRKVITTGDGGMVTTANPEWDRKFRLLRHHGMGISDSTRHAAGEVIFESYETLGYNYRMTDIQAAVGREQLKRLPAILEKRRALAVQYREKLGRIPGLRLPEEPSWARSNWQSYCVRLPEGVDQREVMQRMLDQGVATRRGIMCSHQEAAYADKQFWSSAGELKESERAEEEAILLPLYPEMSRAEQDRVVEVLAGALEPVKR